jgi:opacity protein-like surface antigen
MKRLLVPALLLLGGSCAAQAQLAAPAAPKDEGNVAVDFATTSAARTTLIHSYSATATDSLFLPGMKSGSAPTAAAALALPFGDAEAAAPSPKPKFLYGGRDDYRWQLGLGFDLFRFQNSVFTATAFGIKTSLSYFLNDWFAVEGTVSTAFAPEIFAKEHVKTLLYGGGPKIAWRQRKWEPWLHVIVGGAHEQPQTAKGGKNALGIQAGGGVDYRFNPRFSGRLGGDYVHTSFFGQSQNNYEASAGIVVHF